MHRRTFTKALTAGAALTASGVSLNTLAALLGPQAPSSGFSCKAFRQCVGSSFALEGNPDEMLELVEVEAASASRPDEQFYLCFRSRSGALLEEGVHKLVDGQGGNTVLWLNKSQSKPGIMEAVINLQTSV